MGSVLTWWVWTAFKHILHLFTQELGCHCPSKLIIKKQWLKKNIHGKQSFIDQKSSLLNVILLNLKSFSWWSYDKSKRVLVFVLLLFLAFGTASHLYLLSVSPSLSFPSFLLFCVFLSLWCLAFTSCLLWNLWPRSYSPRLTSFQSNFPTTCSVFYNHCLHDSLFPGE